MTTSRNKHRRSSSIFQSRGFPLSNIVSSFGGLSVDNPPLFPKQTDRRRRRLTSFTKLAEDVCKGTPQLTGSTSPTQFPLSNSLVSVNSFGLNLLNDGNNISTNNKEVYATSNGTYQKEYEANINNDLGMMLERGSNDINLQDDSILLERENEVTSSNLLLEPEDKPLLGLNIFDSPQIPFTPGFMSFTFVNSLKIDATDKMTTKTSDKNPYSNIIESSDLYNLDLEKYYSSTSSHNTEDEIVENLKEEKEWQGRHKRNKAEIRLEWNGTSRIKEDYKDNISMAPSLDGAPVLKLRRRAIERLPEKSYLRTRSTTRVLSEQIKANRSLFNNPFESVNGKTKAYIDNRQPHGGWIGCYSPKRRQDLLNKFLEKRKRRVWNKKIRYAVRKNFADSRLRVKGRFVSKGDEKKLRDVLLFAL